MSGIFALLAFASIIFGLISFGFVVFRIGTSKNKDNSDFLVEGFVKGLPRLVLSIASFSLFLLLYYQTK